MNQTNPTGQGLYGMKIDPVSEAIKQLHRDAQVYDKLEQSNQGRLRTLAETTATQQAGAGNVQSASLLLTRKQELRANILQSVMAIRDFNSMKLDSTYQLVPAVAWYHLIRGEQETIHDCDTKLAALAS